jgi:hypothetical protein
VAAGDVGRRWKVGGAVFGTFGTDYGEILLISLKRRSIENATRVCIV